MEKLKVELSMNYVVTAWKIILTVYEREYRTMNGLQLLRIN